jgi:signal transduction histidine kinase
MMSQRIDAVGASAADMTALAAAIAGHAEVGLCESVEHAEAARAPVVVLFAEPNAAAAAVVRRLCAGAVAVVVVAPAVEVGARTDLTGAGATDVVERGDDPDAIHRLGVALRLALAEARIRSLEVASADAATGASDFSRLITHDIRGALSTMGLACDVLRSALSGAPAAKYLDSIDRAMTRAGGTLETMGDLIAIETGRAAMEPSNVDARDILERARTGLAAKAAKSGVPLMTRGPDNPVMVMLDSTRMTQALMALADIALIYSRGAPIELGLDRDPARVVFSVVAPELEVAPDQVPSIYARAWRGPEGKGSLQYGAALAVAVAARHGGHLDVRPGAPGMRMDLVIPTR